MKNQFVELISHGYDLIPVRITPDNKKIPAYRGWQTARGLTLPEAIAAKLVGVRLKPDDLIIDVDPRNGGTLSAVGDWIWRYPLVDTRSGGWHIYTKLPSSWAGRRLRHILTYLPGVEFKISGRFVVAPGSPEYTWNLASASLPAPVVPDFILSMIDKPEAELAAGRPGEWSPAQLSDVLSTLNIVDYQSHDQWFSLMCAAHESTNGLGLSEFLRWSLADPVYALDEQVIRDRWASLAAGKPGNAGPGTLLKTIADANGVPPASIVADDFSGVDDLPMADASPDEPEFDDDISSGAWPMDRMCKKFKAVDDSGKLRIYAQRRDDVLRRSYWVRYAKRDFIEVCSSVLHMPPVKRVIRGTDGTEDEEKFVPRSTYWLDMYKKKTTYNGVVFAPEHDSERTPDGRLNLWRGFAVRPAPGSWEILKELIWDTLCSEDVPSYEYVMNWMARSVQYMSEPGSVAVVFRGRKGTGKSTLGQYLAALFGAHGMHITSQTLLTGRFNAHLRDVVLLFADEAFWAGDKSGEGVLKGLITDQMITYEGKGTNAESGRNCVHTMLASNEYWVVPAGLDDERRFAVFNVVPDPHDVYYWKRLRDEMALGGLAGMLYELQTRDISSFDVFKVPQTAGLTEQKILSLDPVTSWLYESAKNDWEDFGPVLMNGANRCHRTDEVYSSYIRACDRRGIRSVKLSDVAIGIAIARTLPVHKLRIKALDSDRQHYFYSLPTAQEALELLGKKL